MELLEANTFLEWRNDFFEMCFSQEGQKKHLHVHTHIKTCGILIRKWIKYLRLWNKIFKLWLVIGEAYFVNKEQQMTHFKDLNCSFSWLFSGGSQSNDANDRAVNKTRTSKYFTKC